MCVDCIRTIVDITEGIPKQATIHYCRSCGRYLQPPAQWFGLRLWESWTFGLVSQRSSKDSARCRKTYRCGIHMDWTSFAANQKLNWRSKRKYSQPLFFSRLLKSNLSYRTNNVPTVPELWPKIHGKLWCKSVRKLTISEHSFTLSNLILRHNAQVDTINIKEVKEGLDFHFAQRNHAIKMVDFLSSVVPVRSKSSERLISTDIHSNTSNYKFTYAVEIVPICKDDLITLPRKLANSNT